MFESQGGFSNFWHYNRLKVVSVVALIFFIGFAISQCSFGETVDFGILHVSEVRDVAGDGFVSAIKKDVDLKSENNEPSVQFVPIYVPSDPRDIMETGALEHIQVELVSGKATLYMLDEETIYSYKNDDLFFDLTSIADKYQIPDELRYVDDNGKTLAISVDGNKYLNDCSLECSSLYIAIKNHTDNESEKYINAFNALSYIISNR
ncbi:MAG: hypothetical protein E7395_02420 [Ruminococcaceae bacterium]|nr:hypothetical protein [Oscillospiraceae bacterium]